MTEKQMISTLKGLTFGTVVGSKGVEALDMAIKALSQEPCDDAISREAVLRLIENKPYDWSNLTERHNMLMEIRKLPPVTQKSDKYRKEAKRWKNKWLKSQKSGKWNEYYTSQKGNNVFNCKECGHTFVVMQGKDNMNFCPNCGAKMESEEV